MQLLDFEKEITLENERVQLRPLAESDFGLLLPFSINEPNLWQYSLVSAGGSEENLQNYLKIAFDAKARKDSYPFIVFDKQAQKYAGSTRFYDYKFNHKTIQLGYTWYGKEFWGTGLNKNCKYLMLQYAFETLGLARVEFRADNNNERSKAAMKSLGCTVEGVLRSNCTAAAGRRDSVVLSILSDEWGAGVKERLAVRL